MIVLYYPKQIYEAKTAKKPQKKRPKDRSYVNKSQEHEVAYAPSRKTAAKNSGQRNQLRKKRPLRRLHARNNLLQGCSKAILMFQSLSTRK